MTTVDFKEFLEEAFSQKNINTIWENRNSSQDIIGLEGELPIRYKLNETGSRNVELMLNSNYGYFYKTLALIEDSDILFPYQFQKFGREIGSPFKMYGLKSEIDIMIGAFSMETLALATRKTDINSYTSNGIEYEMVVAFDGNMQTYKKAEEGMASLFPMAQYKKSSLDQSPLSVFKIDANGLGIFPSNDTNPWLQKLIPQRLLEVYTVED